MPVIPTNFNVDRSPFSGGDIRAEASPEQFSAPGRALAGAGAEVSAEAQRFGEYYANATRQKQAANLTFAGMSQLADAQEKWSRVPDAKEAEDGFNQDSAKIRQQITDQISDPEVQATVLHALNQHAIYSQLAVQNRAFGLESSQHRADLDTQLNGYAQMAGNAKDPIGRAQMVDAATGAVKGSVAAGWMYAEQGEDRLLKFRDQVWGNALRQGLESNPGATLQSLDSGDYDSRLSLPQRQALQPLIDRARAGQVAAPWTAQVGGTAPYDPRGMAPVIRASAQKYGIDPNTALRVAQSEGLGNPLGDRDAQGNPTSFGAFQLHTAPGAMGADFQRDTGLDPRDPKNEPATIDYALSRAAQGGWGPFRGAGRAGIGVQAGIGGNPAMATGPRAPPPIEDAVTAIQGQADRGEISQNVADGAIHQVHARYTEWESATHAERLQLARSIEDGKAMLQDGKDWAPPAGAIDRLYPADIADETNRQIAEARESGQARNAVQFASPGQITQLQAQAIERLNNPIDYARNSRYKDQLALAIKNRDAALTSDPANYVATSPIVADARAKIDPQNPSTEQNAIGLSLAEQDRLGVDDARQRALTKPEAAAAVTDILKADPGQQNIAATIDQAAQRYGQYWPRVWGDLVKANLPPAYQVLGIMTTPDQAAAAGDMQRMITDLNVKGGVEKLEDAAPAAAVKSIKAGLPATMEPFRMSMRDPERFSVFNDAVRNLAIWYAYQGVDPDTAARRAYNGVIGAKYDFGPGNLGDALRTPKGQLGTVQAAGAAIQAKIDPAQLSPTIPGNPQLTDAQRTEIYRDAISRGFWATNAGDDGAALMLRYRNGATAPARLYDGSPIEFKFANAAQIAATGGNPTSTPAGPTETPSTSPGMVTP